MRLREFSTDKMIRISPDIKSEYINKTTKKSSWTPKEGRNRWLDQYIQEVKNDVIKNLKKRDFKINITKQENKAMKDLLEDNSIIIRPKVTKDPEL